METDTHASCLLLNEHILYEGNIPAHTSEGVSLQSLWLIPEYGISEDSRKLVEKMREACQQTSETSVIQWLTHQESPWDYLNKFHPTHLILFGCKLQKQHIHIEQPVHRPFRFAGIKCLYAASIQELMTNPGLKSQLWNQGLKPLFGIQ